MHVLSGQAFGHDVINKNMLHWEGPMKREIQKATEIKTIASTVRERTQWY